MNSKNTIPISLQAAIAKIKTAILNSQLNAARKVNAEMLSLNYGIGQYVSENSRKGYWGKGALEIISMQLQKELPGLRGYSSENLKKMRLFYEEWNSVISNSVATATELSRSPESIETEEINTKSLLRYNSVAVATEFNVEDFLSLSFTHHIEILHKVKDIKERCFYIHQSVLNRWDKYTLRNKLSEGLYNHQSALPNNFSSSIPDSTLALKAIETFKDEYLLDFINVEELMERDKADIDERVIEQTIVHNVKKFIMTFGRDFTFVGNQYHLEAFGIEHFPDLLFFNRELNALVCVELKKGDFKPSYLGQLTTYLRILDDQIRKPHENPSIGIVLCKDADKKYVEYVIQDFNKPMGVATYKTTDEMPADLRDALPDTNELKKLL